MQRLKDYILQKKPDAICYSKFINCLGKVLCHINKTNEKLKAKQALTNEDQI